jgi:hypothetical protein
VRNRKQTEGIGPLTRVPYYFVQATCQKCGVVFQIGHLACRCRHGTHMRACKCIVNGHKFDSLSEARRYSKLAFLYSRHIITDLELQPMFKIEHNGVHICKYFADFRFKYEGKTFVEDVKGKRTNVFNLKKKLLAAFYPEVNLILVHV